MKKTYRYFRQFQDYLQELFPIDFNLLKENNFLGINGISIKDITIQVTEDCNLKCTYCYQHNKTPNKLKVEDGKKFIDIILASDERSKKYIQSKKCQGCVLNFIGGEPLLEIDTIDILTDYFINKMIELNHPWLFRYKINIGSNGLLYFDEKVQNYIKKNQGHLSIGITIDGNKELHDKCRLDHNGKGSYDRAIAALKHYQNTYNVYGLSKITLAPENINCFKQSLIDFIEKDGERQIYANCVYEKGWTVEHAKILYKELKDISNYLLNNNLQDDTFISILDLPVGTQYMESHSFCGGNGDMIALDVYGDIYPCIRYTPSSIGNPNLKFKIGDVEHGFIYNEEQEQRLKCLACITRQSQDATTENCTNCPISSGCGDCAAYSYEVFGEVGHRTTYICDMHKARVLAAVYYKNKCFQKTGIKEPLPMNCPKEWAVPIIGEEEYNMLCDLANKSFES